MRSISVAAGAIGAGVAAAPAAAQQSFRGSNVLALRGAVRVQNQDAREQR